MSAQDKLNEAKFFLELLQALEEKGASLTNNANSDQEASYLFSAIVNALYSAVAILEETGVDVAQFRKDHAELYASGRKGGVRAVTVHKQHVRTAFSRTAPFFGEPAFSLREHTELPPEPSPSQQNRHYVVLPGDWSVVHALEFCHYHFCQLREFTQQAQCAHRAPPDGPPSKAVRAKL